MLIDLNVSELLCVSTYTNHQPYVHYFQYETRITYFKTFEQYLRLLERAQIDGQTNQTHEHFSSLLELHGEEKKSNKSDEELICANTLPIK